MKTLIGSLIVYERITTTEAKAKELKSRIDRIMIRSKNIGDEAKKLATVRSLRSALPQMAVEKLTQEDFRKRFAKRFSGFTRVVKLPPRKSDSARMAIIEFVD
jgi:large subunit ribosomal protein L17